MRKVLALFLALILSFSCLSEGENPQQEETPKVEVEEIVDEQIIQEAETQHDCAVEEVQEEKPQESADAESNSEKEEVDTPAEEKVETDTSTGSGEILSEQRQENQTESVSSNIQVVDEGSGKSSVESKSEQITIPASEETLEIESESENKDVQVEEVKDEDAEEEQTVQEVPAEDAEEADENTGVDDDTTEQTSEKEAAETEEEHADVSEAVESEDKGVEDGSKVETEADSEIETVEELDGSTADDVSRGDSVLTTSPMVAFAAPKTTSAEQYYMTFSGRTTLYSTDATNNDVVTFTSNIPDDIVQMGIYVGGIPEKTIWGYLWDDCIWTNFYASSAKTTITYAQLYSMLNKGTVTITVRMHSNKSLNVINVWKTITFTKFTVSENDLATITCSVEARVTGSLTGYPGDDGFTINAITSWSGNSTIQTAVSNGELTLTHTLYVCYDNGEWEEQGDPTKMSYNYVETAFHEGMHTSIQYKYVISW